MNNVCVCAGASLPVMVYFSNRPVTGPRFVMGARRLHTGAARKQRGHRTCTHRVLRGHRAEDISQCAPVCRTSPVLRNTLKYDDVIMTYENSDRSKHQHHRMRPSRHLLGAVSDRGAIIARGQTTGRIRSQCDFFSTLWITRALTHPTL